MLRNTSCLHALIKVKKIRVETVITRLKIPKTGMTLVRNELLTTKLFSLLYTFAFSTWKKKIAEKVYRDTRKWLQVQTQLLPDLNTAKSWVTQCYHSTFCQNTWEKHTLRDFLVFFCRVTSITFKQQLATVFSKAHFVSKRCRWRSKHSPVGSGSCTDTNPRGERSSQHLQVRVSYVLCTDFL